LGYVGNKPALNYTTFAVQHFTTSATTGYTLDNAVTNENGIALFINNVRQQPGSSYAYTASGTTLTLSAATTTSDTMYCVFIGKAVQTVNPPAGSVAASQLATDAVTTVKILDTAVTGAKLNDDAISGQGALGAEPADTDEFLVSDAGVLKRVDYSYIKGITQTSFLPNAQPLVINGDMAVAQRGTSSTGITGTGYNTVDRFGVSITTAGTWTQTQEALTSGNAFADGFSTALKMDCTTADASLAAGDFCLVRYMFEGQDLQLLKKGTANAETMTVAFWVKATKTGTNIVALYDADNTRVCCGSYTISVTNTWEFKVVNIAADTSGVLDNDNAKSIYLDFGMAAGTNYTSGTLPTAWESWVAADWFVGQVNHADSTSNNFHITGVQLEVGTYTSADLPPFRHESYGDNLLRCQRYFYMVADGRLGSGGTNNSAGFVAMGYCHVGNSNYFAGGGTPCAMRTAPSMTTLAGTGYYNAYRENGADAFDSIVIYSMYQPQANFRINGTGNVSATQGTGCQILLNSASTYVALNAEL